jgi:hypothetical protein
MKITIKWEVADGYVGKSRPQTTVFNTEDEFDNDEWEELDEDSKREAIECAVQQDFENRISFEINDYGI